DTLPQLGRDFKRAQAVADITTERMLPDVSVDDLRAAWADILKRARLNQHHHITREQLSVRDHMTHILRRLNDVPLLEFGEQLVGRLCDGATVAVVVVHAIAIPQLARKSMLAIAQALPYAPIYVRRAYPSVAAAA